MSAQSLLEVTHYETQVYLGWTDDERQHPQTIAVDIRLRYLQLPKACTSDALLDTHCYAQLLNWVEVVCQSQPFKLIEHLAHAIYATLKQHLSQPALPIFVRVHKLHPPIPALQCASFSIQDAGC